MILRGGGVAEVTEALALGFTVQRGDSLSRESVDVTVVFMPATGAVDAPARGFGSWSNGGEPIRMTNSAADDVARRVHEECSVAAPAA
jgi:hypothetical protein